MARKRGQNEGSIFKRKDGRWCCKVTVEGSPVYRYFKTQAECRDWLRITQAQLQSGLSLQAHKPVWQLT